MDELRRLQSELSSGGSACFPYNIFLIGFMGSGKSTISACLSRAFSMEAVEMDRLIVKREGMSISDIFAVHGEEYFRGLETGLLTELLEKQNVVVSCGGGVPMRTINVAKMKENGRVVLLSATPETILERVKNSHDRPLLEGHKEVSYISELMEKRRPKYEAAADITVVTDKKSEREICAELVRKLLEMDKKKEGD